MSLRGYPVCACAWKVFVMTVCTNFLTRSNPGHHCGINSWTAPSSAGSSFLFPSLSGSHSRVYSHTHTHTHTRTPVILVVISANPEEAEKLISGFMDLNLGKGFGGLVMVGEECRLGASDERDKTPMRTHKTHTHTHTHSALCAVLELPSVPVINRSGLETYGLWWELCGTCCHTQRSAVTLLSASSQSVHVQQSGHSPAVSLCLRLNRFNTSKVIVALKTCGSKNQTENEFESKVVSLPQNKTLIYLCVW